MKNQSNNNQRMKDEKPSTTSGGSGSHGRFHINRETLPLKVTLFLYYGAMAAILPYLTIHMKDIGISLSEIAIIYAVLPVTAFLGPPIMGFMADKLGQYKAVLIVATVINGVSHSLLLAVPKYSESPVYAHTVIEINGLGGSSGEFIPAGHLRPAEISLCPQFLNSLKPDDNTEGIRNSIINVHSCSYSTGGNPLSRGLVHKWNIPHICKLDITADDTIQSLKCIDDEHHHHHHNHHNHSRQTREVGKNYQYKDPECSLKVNLNSISEGVNHQLICRTNYTFPSGEVIKNGNNQLTFWLYFLIRTIGNIFMSACFSLLDATTLAIVKANKGAEYGRERILCVFGFAILSPVAGLLVDAVSSAKGYTDYSAAFYLANGMLCLNILGYIFMRLDVEKPSEDMWKDATKLLNYPEVIVFLTMIFIMGNMWGFVESYLFVFLDELNAPKYLLGLTLTIGSLASVPFLYGAEEVVKRAGRVNIIVLAFLVYFVRFFGYSYIPNPFWCFPFEAMEAFTFHLMWVAAATYCAVLSPKGLLGTLTGVMGSLHYGLGKGSGAFIGGFVINMSSTRLAFRYFGVFGGTMGLIYFLINKVWLEGAIQRRNERENQAKLDTEVQNEQKQAMLEKQQKSNVRNGDSGNQTV